MGLCLVLSTFSVGKWYSNVVYAAKCDNPPPQDRFPDLRTVVPQHLQIVNAHGNEVLRLTNGIANMGPGAWQMIPVNPNDNTNDKQKANQQFLDAKGNVVATCTTASSSEYHPAHKHFHISDVAGFEVRIGSKDGVLFGHSSLKVTSCLIDWVRLEGNSPDNERGYSSCDSGVQGISSGWVDQYHMALEGQSIDMTGADPGKYYLVSTANPKGYFMETDKGNNVAWVAFQLSRDSNGNPKIVIGEHSKCTGGLCGEDLPNR
jgi:lysyl oxidase